MTADAKKKNITELLFIRSRCFWMANSASKQLRLHFTGAEIGEKIQSVTKKIIYNVMSVFHVSP